MTFYGSYIEQNTMLDLDVYPADPHLRSILLASIVRLELLLLVNLEQRFVKLGALTDLDEAIAHRSHTVNWNWTFRRAIFSGFSLTRKYGSDSLPRIIHMFLYHIKTFDNKNDKMQQ